MYDTIEEVSKNKYINNLVNEAALFHMYGVYVKFSKAKKPQNNGIYFVCGYDKDKVLDENSNIERMCEEQCNSQGTRIDLHITKITNQSPFAVHQEVLRYCNHASTFRAICNMCRYTIDFTIVSQEFINILEMFYLNSIDKSIPNMERDKNRKAMYRFLHEEANEEKILQGYNLDGPAVHLRPEKLDKKCSNMVSLVDLVYKTLGVKQLVVSMDKLPLIKNELNKHPEILYFQAKPVVARLNMPHNQGYGSKKANTTTSVKIFYDAFYSEQMDLIFLKAIHPKFFRYSTQDLKEKYGDVCSFGIGYADLDAVFSRAIKLNIPICLDVNRIYFSYNPEYTPDKNVAGYNVVIPKKYFYDMDAVLQAEANEVRDIRVLTKQDQEKYSYQPTKGIILDKEMDEAEQEKKGFFRK